MDDKKSKCENIINNMNKSINEFFDYLKNVDVENQIKSNIKNITINNFVNWCKEIKKELLKDIDKN